MCVCFREIAFTIVHTTCRSINFTLMISRRGYVCNFKPPNVSMRASICSNTSRRVVVPLCLWFVRMFHHLFFAVSLHLCLSSLCANRQLTLLPNSRNRLLFICGAYVDRGAYLPTHTIHRKSKWNVSEMASVQCFVVYSRTHIVSIIGIAQIYVLALLMPLPLALPFTCKDKTYSFIQIKYFVWWFIAKIIEIHVSFSMVHYIHLLLLCAVTIVKSMCAQAQAAALATQILHEIILFIHYS